MKLARVVGTVVSTVSVPVFDGRTLLLCDLVGPDGSPAGGHMIAMDTVGAGPGETVLLLDEGNGARQILGAPNAPIRTLVVGIVDAVTNDAEAAAGSPSGPDAPAPGPAPEAARGPASAPARSRAPRTRAPRTSTPGTGGRPAPPNRKAR